MSEPLFIPQNRSYRKPPKDNTALFLGGAIILALFAIVATVLLVDEVRYWNAERHVKEQVKEINRQFDKADREIKKASDDFDRAMKKLND